MRQLIMEGPKKSKVIDVEIPSINDNQILVKVVYTGMCHSELYPWENAKSGTKFGHETVGVVADVGKNVQGFKVGDRVTGLGGGGYKEYIVMVPEKAVLVPDNISDEDAVVEPLACIYSGAERIANGNLDEAIAIVGTGYMGLGLISLLKGWGYKKIVAIDKRPEALENARKYGADEVYLPEEIPMHYILNWQTWLKPDLTRDGHKTDIFNTGFKTVVEFAGTEDALDLAGQLVCAHGTLGIAGFHNDGPRTVDFKLWNMKAITMINCHERRIEYEAKLCRKCLDEISSGQWKFTGAANKIYTLEEFDKANEDMKNHNHGFIKGLFKSN